MTVSPRPLKQSTRFYAAAASVCGVVVLLAGLALFTWTGPGATSMAIGGPFQLTQGDGRPATQASWPGKYLLIYFGYTYCPDVCPTTLTNVAGALDKLGAQADRVQPLFITIDPKRDTPQVLEEYTAAFGKRLVGLTGDATQIAQVAKEFRVYYAVHRTGPGPDDYLMDHSSVVYLMAPDGHFISVIQADQPPAAMAQMIAEHLS